MAERDPEKLQIATTHNITGRKCVPIRSSELYSSMVDRYMDSTFLDVFLLVSIVLFVFICISSVVVFGNITSFCDYLINAASTTSYIFLFCIFAVSIMVSASQICCPPELLRSTTACFCFLLNFLSSRSLMLFV